jgi:hypothetical protein
MQDYLRQIAEGGDFDHTEAIRALAMLLTTGMVAGRAAGEGAASALPVRQDEDQQKGNVPRQPVQRVKRK